MGGGTLHALPQLRNILNCLSSSSSSSSSSSYTLPNLQPPNSTDNSTLFTPYNTLSSSRCQSKLCSKLEKTESGCLHNHVFESVPTQQEVEDAVSALQEFMQVISFSSTLHQISGSYDSRIVLSQGYKRLHEALQLLQADPDIKRLVVSLSSDKAIWDAVMGNVLHQQHLELPDSVKCRRSQISEQNEFGMQILSWIFDIIKGKIWELIESFQLLMNDLFQSPRRENATADATELDEKVRSSTLLSIIILLIVIMARSQSV